MKLLNQQKTVTVNNCELEVTYNYYYDPGRHTLPNGDPGWPESEEIEITSLKLIKGELLSIIDPDTFDKTTEEVSRDASELRYSNDKKEMEV